MNTAELIKEATRIANIRADISNANQKAMWQAIKDNGLEKVGIQNGGRDESGQCTPHERWPERSAILDAAYAKTEEEYITAGVTEEFVMSGDVICEVTTTTKWNGRRHLSHRFYILKGYKKSGEIKRGRFTAAQALAKLG